MASGSINVKVWISVGDTEPQVVGTAQVPLRLTTVGGKTALVTSGLDEAIEVVKSTFERIYGGES